MATYEERIRLREEREELERKVAELEKRAAAKSASMRLSGLTPRQGLDAGAKLFSGNPNAQSSDYKLPPEPMTPQSAYAQGWGNLMGRMAEATRPLTEPTKPEDEKNTFLGQATTPTIAANVKNIAKLPFSMGRSLGEGVGGGVILPAKEGRAADVGAGLSNLTASLVPGQMLNQYLGTGKTEPGQEFGPALDLLAMYGITKGRGAKEPTNAELSELNKAQAERVSGEALKNYYAKESKVQAEAAAEAQSKNAILRMADEAKKAREKQVGENFSELLAQEKAVRAEVAGEAVKPKIRQAIGQKQAKQGIAAGRAVEQQRQREAQQLQKGGEVVLARIRRLPDEALQAEYWELKGKSPEALETARSMPREELEFVVSGGRFGKKPNLPTEFNMGVPLKDVIPTLDAISSKLEDTYGYLKEAFKTQKGTVGQGLDAMTEHRRAERTADYRANLLSQGVLRDVPDPGRRLLIMKAIDNPDVYARELNPQEIKVMNHLKNEQAQITQMLVDAKVIDPKEAKENYIFHWWKNRKTGEAQPATYGPFAKTAPQLNERRHMTIDDGIAAGLELATDNPGDLVGMSLRATTRAVESRRLVEMLRGLKSPTGGILTTTSQRGSTIKAKSHPLGLVENWNTLKANGIADDYIPFDNFALNEKTFHYRNGVRELVEQRAAVHKDIYPWVKAYFDSPSYGTMANLNFASKSLKLGLSFFHPLALAAQAIATGRPSNINYPKGLTLFDKADPIAEMLVRNGIERRGHQDIQGMGKMTKIPVAGKLTDWMFNELTPGLKMMTAYNELSRLLPEYQKRGISNDIAARDVVRKVDAMYSHEDVKLAALESSRIMAQMYYAPQARKAWQMAFISPTWQKAHAQMFGRSVASLVPDAVRAKMGLEPKNPISKTYQEYVIGAGTIYAAANLYNYITTKQMDGEGKFLWQQDDKFSVRAMYNEPDGAKAYFRPLKSIFEVPEFLGSPLEKIGSKLAPIWSSTARLFEAGWNYRDRMEDERTSLDKGIEFATDVATPISFGNLDVGDAGRRILDVTGIYEDSTLGTPRKSVQSRIIGGFGIPTSRGEYADSGRQALENVREMSDAFQKERGYESPRGGKSPESLSRRRLFEALAIDDDSLAKTIIPTVEPDEFGQYLKNRFALKSFPKALREEFESGLTSDQRHQIDLAREYLQGIAMKYDRLYNQTEAR